MTDNAVSLHESFHDQKPPRCTKIKSSLTLPVSSFRPVAKTDKNLKRQDKYQIIHLQLLYFIRRLEKFSISFLF